MQPRLFCICVHRRLIEWKAATTLEPTKRWPGLRIGISGSGGVLMVTVPAHASLWSYFDEFSGHFRRYAPDELRGKIERTGFKIEYQS